LWLPGCQRCWHPTGIRSLHKKPRLVVTQGDPLEARGISAITPRVAAEFGLSRGLVCLDESQPGIIKLLEGTIDRDIDRKNQKREALGKTPLKDYFRDFALLQEVTRAAWSHLCGGITVIHTSSEINELSVTSFYTVGLELGLISPGDMVQITAPMSRSLSAPDHGAAEQSESGDWRPRLWVAAIAAAVRRWPPGSAEGLCL